MTDTHFFVSYAGSDRSWAEWVAWHLEKAGYSVELDVWDWRTGENAPRRMNEALARAEVVIALFSPAYFARERFTSDEWTAVMAQRPDRRQRLVPLRVAEVAPPPLLASLLWRDLFNRDERGARDELLAAVAGPRRPSNAPVFPGAATGEEVTGPRMPGSLPRVWKVPLRNPAFTGREQMLATLRQRLCAGDQALVQSLHGMGGVGKTQLAVEYAYLFAGDYRLVWWVDAERPDLIQEQLAQLAVTAGWVAEGSTTTAAVKVTMRQLRAEGRKLLVFDNAQSVEHIKAWLPSGDSHVVITSRSSQTGGVAVTVSVDVFARAESMGLLNIHLPALQVSDADRLAAALGDLPLALAQAAGLLSETGMTVDEYLAELAEHASELLSDAPAPGYPVPLAAVINTSVERLARVDPTGVHLLRLCAMLAPEPIPLEWFNEVPADVLGPTLAALRGSRLAFRRTLGRLAELGLARSDNSTVQVHRLIQAVLRDTNAGTDECRERARQLIAAAAPDDDGSDPASWPRWARLLPHLFALEPERSVTLSSTLHNALSYLNVQGEYRTVLRFAESWHRHRVSVGDSNNEHALAAATLLAVAHRYLGHREEARRITEDTLARYRLIHGEDHPETLRSAGNLAADLRVLGEVERARQLNQDTLARYRRAFGDDHPATMRSAANLAADMRALEEFEQAHQLDRDTLRRRRRVLGDDHPDTLRSAGNLAADLQALGRFDEACRLDEDTLTRYRRVLGDDHPATLRAALSLASDLRALGEVKRAYALDEDTLARYRRVLGDDHPGTIRAANSLAEDLRALGE